MGNSALAFFLFSYQVLQTLLQLSCEIASAAAPAEPCKAMPVTIARDGMKCMQCCCAEDTMHLPSKGDLVHACQIRGHAANWLM